MMLRLTQVLGGASDPEIADALHAREYDRTVEHISLEPADTARKPLRATTDADTDCAKQNHAERLLAHLEFRRARVLEDG